MSDPSESDQLNEIAIIGMACRFPGAGNVGAFWRNLQAGVESITCFSDQELAAAGLEPGLLGAANYVKARPVLEDIERFDAALFKITPREAASIDPQQRLFLECAWEALEHAGYDPEIYPGQIGIYAGTEMNTYLLNNLLTNRDVMLSLGGIRALIASDKDYLTTRVAHKLNLRGPSITVQTACSTSLVAVHLAFQSLLIGETDMALAGGVSVQVPHRVGYIHEDGGIFSPDGHCRAFDAQARGTVFGSGAGVVVLRRLADALRDGDHIHAVIKGSATNNDGAAKIGYTAPSVSGQAAVITEALSVAGVAPETIGYIEAHGTGTELGDPIEITALTQAFRRGTQENGFCAIGSVKTNIGHLMAAAGIAGLIKAVLTLEHRQIPASLHFRSPNPQIDFARTPFYVNTQLRDWHTGEGPRRAGVSSFGIGGANAHVVLEEAPAIEPSGRSRRRQLLALSARSEAALERMTGQLAAHVREQPELNLPDIAYTLHAGRAAFEHRRVVVCGTLDEAIAALEGRSPAHVFTGATTQPDRRVAWMFSGQGAQYTQMGRGLYESEPAFRAAVERCAEILKPHLGLDLRDILYPTNDDKVTRRQGDKVQSSEDSITVSPGHRVTVSGELDQTQYTQPALFVVEYALAALWQDWGLQPDAMIGHSLGEYVAACLAGVFSLEDALALVAERGRLMQSVPPGSMLAVPLSETDIQPWLDRALTIAAVNSPSRCVVAGPTEAIVALERRLSDANIDGRRLRTSHAFHSPMMEPVAASFRRRVEQVRLRPPAIPYLSNVTGDWISPEEATNPDYWVAQLCRPVRFSAGISKLAQNAQYVLLEVGPGQTLRDIAQRHPDCAPEQVILASMRHPDQERDDAEVLLATLGQLWLAGVKVDWPAFYKTERRLRVPLPTYPFERERCWIEPGQALYSPAVAACPPDLPAPAPPSQATPELRLAKHARPRLSTPYTAPRDAVEARLAALWHELIGIEQIGVDDNFFELGGDSLLAVQVVNRSTQTFGVDLPLSLVFKAPTVAGLAQTITEKQAGQPGSAQAVQPIPHRDGDTFPLSFAQQRLWFIDQLVPDTAAYNISLAVRIIGPLRVDILEQSINAVIRRQAALRTTFALIEGQPRQTIHPDLNVALQHTDLSDLSDTEQAAKVHELATEADLYTFDLAAGPLIRTLLVHLDPEQHVLILTLHHVISDGQSMPILLREIGACYEALASNRPPLLAELPITYADFAAWQSEWLQGTALDQQLSYWKQRLHGAPTALNLPIDHPRPVVQSFRGAQCEVQIPPATIQGLHRLAQPEGATLFMALFAAFASLLSHYTGQADLTIGSPITNRNRAETEGLIGLFVNTLVLRIDLSGGPTPQQLLGRVRQVALEAYAHAELPFEKLVDELHVQRNLSHSPLFQIMFVLQDTAEAAIEWSQLRLITVPVERKAAQFDLVLRVYKGPECVKGIFEYNTALFEAETIARLAEHYVILLQQFATDPEQRLSDVVLLTPQEQRQLAAWNATEVDYPQHQRLHQLIELQAERTPDAVAVVSQGEYLAYRALNRRANQLAHDLHIRGVKPGDPVGIFMERSLELVIALLGTLKAGGAYLPLDPEYPQERLAFMIEDAGISILLSQSHLIDRIPQRQSEKGQSATLQIISLDRGWEPIATADVCNPGIDIAPDHPAYVIYTSGSTGRPKGAVNTHRGICNRLLWMQDAYQLASADAVLQKTPYSFDVSVWELFWPLLAGARLVMARPGGHRDPDYLVQTINEHAISVLHFVPSMLQLFMTARGLEYCNSLRYVICSGEALPIELQERFFSRLTAQLHNLYGPTEAAVDVSYWACYPASTGRSVPIGHPIANMRLYILNRHLRPVPLGVPGELYIGGVGLAQGYLNRPDLTAERFIPNPFTTTDSNDKVTRRQGDRVTETEDTITLSPLHRVTVSGPVVVGERLYRTGDLARYRPDGAIEFLGRLDYQVKIRGFRIELGEIEAALNRHPGVRESCVVVREDVSPASGYPEKRLVAYLTQEPRTKPALSGGEGNQEPEDSEEGSRSGTPWVVLGSGEGSRFSVLGSGEGVLGSGELRAFLADRLPDYMAPSAYVVLEHLPLLPNGKVDRRALPAPEGARPALKEAFIPPRTRIERMIAATWQAALHTGEVGVHDNFFDIGGHSLLMIEVYNKLRDALERPDLRLFDLFKYPTINTLAEHLASTHDQAGPAFQESYTRAEVRRGALKQLKRRRE